VISFLVDTNIFLDVLLEREEFIMESKRVSAWCGYNSGKVWMAWHSLDTLNYVGTKYAGVARTSKYFGEILETFEISPTDIRSALLARMLPVQDFKGAMQVAAADMAKVDFIITRNLKDLADANI
jgi:hypothetical protein